MLQMLQWGQISSLPNLCSRLWVVHHLGLAPVRPRALVSGNSYVPVENKENLLDKKLDRYFTQLCENSLKAQTKLNNGSALNK